MDDNKKQIMEMRIQKTVAALQKNGMEAMYAPTRKEAIEQVAEYLEENGIDQRIRQLYYTYGGR